MSGLEFIWSGVLAGTVFGIWLRYMGPFAS